ncbi:unnamed protein product [Mytilus coruscus]|uniref:Helicase C-terminal domain-containing protein n=1 Tax=Mytilus coruscus TaxID=42192 RepID=A0A6J8CD36_MYTCO|nr:unnamed protein product [Mytilus coruscus]
MTSGNIFDSKTTVSSGHQCYSTSERPIRSCKERMTFVCNTTSHNGANSTWYESTQTCFAHATTLIQHNQNLKGGLPPGIWLQYFRDMQLIQKSDEIISSISTLKGNTYPVTVYENDFDKTSSSMISYTQTDSSVEHQNLTEIHIINFFLLGGLLLVLVAVLWKVFPKARVRCYEHATKLASNHRTTEQPDLIVDQLDGSETLRVHYSVINDLIGDGQPNTITVNAASVFTYQQECYQITERFLITREKDTDKFQCLAIFYDIESPLKFQYEAGETITLNSQTGELTELCGICTEGFVYEAVVKIRSTERLHDPVEGILLKAIKNVESVFTNRKVTSFLMQDSFETKTLLSALESPPFDKRGTRYLQWISETKRKTESVMLKDADVPRLIHICLRHLELYVECLEMNSLLEIENVTELLTDAYGLSSYESQQASTIQEREIIEALKGLHIDEQLEVMGRFREGEHLCIVATSVACEGLDIPQCNLMIRYKFRVDEISSYQMRGRIRDKGGREVILASSEDFERETKNILRQYYMKNAIEQVIDLDLTAHIAIAERGIYASEFQERLLQQRQADSKTIGAFTVNCKFCGKPVTDGQFIRHIKRKIFIVYDKTIDKNKTRTS